METGLGSWTAAAHLGHDVLTNLILYLALHALQVSVMLLLHLFYGQQMIRSQTSDVSLALQLHAESAFHICYHNRKLGVRFWMTTVIDLSL